MGVAGKERLAVVVAARAGRWLSELVGGLLQLLMNSSLRAARLCKNCRKRDCVV